MSGASSEESRTGSSSYTHTFSADGKLLGCSEAVDFMHYWDDDRAPSLTGYGFCPHGDDADGNPQVVVIDAELRDVVITARLAITCTSEEADRG